MRAPRAWRSRSAARNSSRAGRETLEPVLEAAAKAGAVRYRFADTLGILDPVSRSGKPWPPCAA